MLNDYEVKLSESKLRYHKKKAEMPYEMKVKIIIEMQMLNAEMNLSNPKRSKSDCKRAAWGSEF